MSSALRHIQWQHLGPTLRVEATGLMHTIELIAKLKELDQALDREDRPQLHILVREAQECALRIQRETDEQMRREPRFVRVTS